VFPVRGRCRSGRGSGGEQWLRDDRSPSFPRRSGLDGPKDLLEGLGEPGNQNLAGRLEAILAVNGGGQGLEGVGQQGGILALSRRVAALSEDHVGTEIHRRAIEARVWVLTMVEKTCPPLPRSPGATC
jgi:hypothetical protein